MKLIIKTLAIIAVFVIGMVFIIPMFVPVERVVDEAKQQIFTQTGRTLSLEEAPALSVFPNLHIKLEGVSLSNPDHFNGEFVSIETLLIDIGWSTIFQGELAINAFEIENWTLRLATDQQGKNNWTMATENQAVVESKAAAKQHFLVIPQNVDLAIIKLQLSNGSIEIEEDGESGLVIDNINLAMNMPSLDAALNLDGSINWQNEILASQIRIEPLRALLAGEQARVGLNFKGLNNALNFEGSIAKLGQIVEGKLNLGRVDLRNLQNSGDSQPGDQQSSAWDSNPIDLSPLVGPNVKLDISMTELLTPWLNTQEFEGGFTLINGDLVVDINQFSAYQGSASGRFSLNANNAAMLTQLTFSDVEINGLLNDLVEVDKLQGLGRIAMDVNAKATSVAGVMSTLNGQMGFALENGAVRGFNLAAILKSAKSAIKGDFSKISLDQNFSDAQKTDFSSLEANLEIKQGIANVSKLTMLSPLLRVGGDGNIDLSKKTMDLMLRSSLVASIEGQGASTDSKGITIPVSVSGPWHNISVSPKVSDAAKAKAKAELEKQKDKFIEEKIKSDGAKKLLKGLFSR